MAYDKLRPLRTQLQAGSKIAADIPNMLPQPKILSSMQMQQSTPAKYASPQPVKLARDPLYRAERRIYFWYANTMEWFHSLPDVETYVRGVLVNYREAFSRSDWPLSFAETSERGAWYWGGVITVPIPVQKMALLHELSHHLVGNDVGHGPDFFAVYMTLLRVEMGDEIANRFTAEMNPA